MPAKRKQPGDSAEPSARATRASTRTATTKNTATSRAKAPTGSALNASTHDVRDVVDDSDGMESVHSTKRARTGPSTATKLRKTATKASAKVATQIDHELDTNRKSISKKGSSSTTSQPIRTAPAPKTIKKPKSEPFTPARALALFASLAEKDDVNVIGPEGYQQLCSDANMNLEGTQPLILAWQIGTSEMGKITKDEWVKWTNSLKISSVDVLSMVVSDLENLLISGKPAAKSTTKTGDYDRTQYTAYAANPKSAFQKFYSFCFFLTKAPQSKNIEMETSVAMWSVLLAPKYPIMGDVLQFITEKQGIYRGTNKDLWNMMLEFCESVSPDLHDFEADGAWPTLLDDFYNWKKAKGEVGDSPSEAMVIDQ